MTSDEPTLFAVSQSCCGLSVFDDSVSFLYSLADNQPNALYGAGVFNSTAIYTNLDFSENIYNLTARNLTSNGTILWTQQTYDKGDGDQAVDGLGQIFLSMGNSLLMYSMSGTLISNLSYPFSLANKHLPSIGGELLFPPFI